jgi:hypothetical protein
MHLRKKKRKPTPNLLSLHQTLKVTPKPLQPLLLKRTTKSLLTQLQLKSDLDEGDNDVYNEVDVYVGYRHPRLVDNDDLDDRVLDRLRQAREKAMEKYREHWTKG